MRSFFSSRGEGKDESNFFEPTEPILEDEESEYENIIEREDNEVEVKINTMEDFIRTLEVSRDLTEDQETREQLGHQIVKIKYGINLIGLSSDKVNVRPTSDGVLGFFDPGDKEITVSEEMLKDFSTSAALILHVLRHEEKHKKGIADEGAVEQKLKKEGMTGLSFYTAEQNKFKSAFKRVGTSKALVEYDMKHPDRLMAEFVKIEISKKYKFNKTELENLKREAYFKITEDKEVNRLSKVLRAGVPRLYAKLATGAIRAEIKKVLKEFVEE